MPTEKQIRAARTNGALSRGPITEQGKRNSARNSTRHGLLAQTIVLDEEVTGPFQEILDGLIAEYQPSTASQAAFVNIMAAAQWRLIRIWGLQKTGMDRDMALQDPAVGPAPIRALIALQGSSGGIGAQELLRRYEITYDRQFSRALTRLLELQALPGNRQPEPYNPASPAGPTWKEDPEPKERDNEEPEPQERESEAPEPQEPEKEEPESEEPRREDPDDPKRPGPQKLKREDPEREDPQQEDPESEDSEQEDPQPANPEPTRNQLAPPSGPKLSPPHQGPSPHQGPTSRAREKPEKNATARRTQQGVENK